MCLLIFKHLNWGEHMFAVPYDVSSGLSVLSAFNSDLVHCDDGNITYYHNGLQSIPTAELLYK